MTARQKFGGYPSTESHACVMINVKERHLLLLLPKDEEDRVHQVEDLHQEVQPNYPGYLRFECMYLIFAILTRIHFRVFTRKFELRTFSRERHVQIKSNVKIIEASNKRVKRTSDWISFFKFFLILVTIKIERQKCKYPQISFTSEFCTVFRNRNETHVIIFR